MVLIYIIHGADSRDVYAAHLHPNGRRHQYRGLAKKKRERERERVWQSIKSDGIKQIEEHEFLKKGLTSRFFQVLKSCWYTNRRTPCTTKAEVMITMAISSLPGGY